MMTLEIQHFRFTTPEYNTAQTVPVPSASTESFCRQFFRKSTVMFLSANAGPEITRVQEFSLDIKRKNV